MGGVTEHVYFANRMLKTTKAPATTAGPKAVTDYRYDAAGRVVRTIRPSGGWRGGPDGRSHQSRSRGGLHLRG